MKQLDLPPAIDRRDFLRGSALFAAALGVSFARPLSALAQQQQQQGQEKKQEQEKKKEEKKDAKKDEKNEPAKPKADEQPAEEEANDDKETKIDENGREYRTCPQCGFNMYRQGRTWTCENCGYSYVE